MENTFDAWVAFAAAKLQNFPLDYSRWWLELLYSSPQHVVIETFLIILVLYVLLVKQAYDPARRGGARMSQRDEQELLLEWQPEPLVGPSPGAPSAEGGPVSAAALAPYDFVIAEYAPAGRNVVVKISGDARPKVTFCSMDFLGLGSSEGVRTAALTTLEEYTLGSCGPRGFYGTTRKHLQLEDAIASFMGSPESITYSDTTATIASAIPAFAKRGDLLLLDAGANYGVVTGAKLARSKVLVFRHNDMDHLESFLREVRDNDESKVNDALKQRRFIVVEGLYSGFGDICPLPDVLRLAREYKWRVIVDDSCGVGVLGASGQGVAEHFGLASSDIDVLVGSLATTFCSVGGFCVGSREVVDHQRLSGAGYCFSASAPPFLCATATAALSAMVANPALLQALRKRCVAVHSALAASLPGCEIVSDPRSPIKHVRVMLPVLSSPSAAAAGNAGGLQSPSAARPELLRSRRQLDELLHAIVAKAADLGVLVTRSHASPSEFPLAPLPTLRFCLTLAHTDAEVGLLLQALPEAVAAVVGGGASASDPLSHGKSNGSSNSSSAPRKRK